METTADQMPQTPVKTVMIQNMIDDKVQPDTFTPLPLHHFTLKVQFSSMNSLTHSKTNFRRTKQALT